MLNNDGDWNDDSATKNIMAEGKTLFMLGSNNTFKAGDIDCEFDLMPLKDYVIPDTNYYKANEEDLNSDLCALPVTDQEITSILPTGWRGNIKTVTLTGKRIQELLDTGYNKSGYVFPYVLVAPAGFSLQADTTYTAVICGVSNEAAQEGNITDTGILGLTAAGEYLSQFETLLKKDIRWEK